MRPRGIVIGFLVCLCVTVPAVANFTYNIMLTGYWPPSNEMLREFSPNPTQNPSGWQGGNWEGRGYNIYSYFPEFTSPPPGDNIGYGDFEVDYQDTLADFNTITGNLHPLAIITFGRGSVGNSWEIEYRYRNLPNGAWGNDYQYPYQPTPAPPDGTVAPNYIRYSSLPMTAIRDGVNAAGLGVTSVIDYTGDAGAFLCEFIGYQATWYHARHAGASDLYQNFAAGHIHVGTNVTTNQGRLATETTLRELTGYLDTLIPEPAVGLLLLAALPLCSRRRRYR